MGAAELDLAFAATPATTARFRLGVERALGADPQVHVHTATGIDGSGRLTFEEIVVDGSRLVALEQMTIGVTHEPNERMELGASVAATRDGYGETDAVVGVRALVRF